MNRRNTTVLLVLVLAIILGSSAGVLYYLRSSKQSTKKVVINEAVRTLLYLPLYHAYEKGYFRDEGLDVEIVTGGTATNSFASLVSGQAQFSQADPMYVPISREKGAKTKVLGQVVAKIAVWGLSRDGTPINGNTLKGKTIATQPRPMTAFTYAVQIIKDFGLSPDKDVRIIETQSPNEIVPFLNGDAQFAFTLEPNTSLAVSKGATVAYSCPREFGDQVFTGLMTTEDVIAQDPQMVQGVLNAYQRALSDLYGNPEGGVLTAKKYFPQLDDQILNMAIRRIVSEQVLPRDLRIPEDSWQRSSEVRVRAGDLSKVMSINDAVAGSFAEAAVRKFSN
jgi:NitT/TauT family transport system substrate-binding protein